MKLQLLVPAFTVCKLAEMPALDNLGPHVFFAKTPDEISLVCETARLPAQGVAAAEHGWRALGVMGTLDFGLVGILAGLTAALAKAGVSVFAVSTFNTDYLLVKGAQLEKALDALGAAGYEIAR